MKKKSRIQLEEQGIVLKYCERYLLSLILWLGSAILQGWTTAKDPSAKRPGAVVAIAASQAGLPTLNAPPVVPLRHRQSRFPGPGRCFGSAIFARLTGDICYCCFHSSQLLAIMSLLSRLLAASGADSSTAVLPKMRPFADGGSAPPLLLKAFIIT